MSPDVLALNELYIDRQSTVPLYYQLKEQIRNLIVQGVYTPNQQLPTEEELCKLLSISRPVVRQAYGELIKENLVGRRKGSGTYVMEIPERNMFKEYVSFSYEKNLNYAEDSAILKIEAIRDEEIIQKFKFAKEAFKDEKAYTSKGVYYIERLVSEYGLPNSIIRSFIFEKMAPKFERLFGDVTDHSVVDLFEKNYGFKLVEASRKLYPKVPDETVQRILHISEKSLIYEIETKYYDEFGRMIIVEYLICPTDRMSFSVEVKR